jgi:serine/threonine protein kinase
MQELCKGAVFDFLQKFGTAKDGAGRAKLSLGKRLKYAHDAAKGIMFLHGRRIIHCDLKSQNLLVAKDQNDTVKICDFSMSRMTSKVRTYLGYTLNTHTHIHTHARAHTRTRTIAKPSSTGRCCRSASRRRAT